MSLNHLTSQATPNPNLNPRFQSLVVDTVASVGTLIPGTYARPVVTLAAGTGTYNVTAAQSGTLFIIQGPVTANLTINLPALGASIVGAMFDFLWLGSGDGTHTSQITGAANTLFGSVVGWNGTVTVFVSSAAGGKTSLIRSANAGDLTGDWISIISDGVTGFYVRGSSGSTTGSASCFSFS